jgi:hypothetical protein
MLNLMIIPRHKTVLCVQRSMACSLFGSDHARNGAVAVVSRQNRPRQSINLQYRVL